MKKSAIKFTVFFITFIVALLVISNMMNVGNRDMTMEQEEATFPLVYMRFNHENINCLQGYRNEMKVNYQRDSVITINEERNLEIEIDKNEMKIDSLFFQVRSIDGERLIENSQIFGYVDKGDTIQASFSLKDLIEENKEYSLVLILNTEEEGSIYYYTRIIQATKYYLAEKIEFVKYFNEATFDKTEAKELTRYLESNSDADNTTLNAVSIHSSFKQITWGDLAPVKLGDMKIFVKQVGTQTATIKLHYFIKTEENKDKKYYLVEEYYRVRYASDRMFLLGFERTTNEMFDRKVSNFANNKILLGITSSDIELVESDGGNVLAYISNNQLYSYNLVENKFAILYSSYSSDINDYRNTFRGNGIKILSVEETGNVRFMIYGYMNKGRHEGEVGIQISYYNCSINTLEEELFIPYQKSYDILMVDVEKLAFVSKDNIYYCILDESLYAIDLETLQYAIITTNLKEGRYEVSSSSSMIAWQEGADVNSSDKLYLMNLNTTLLREISLKTDDYVKPLGFMQEDLIYGIARREDITKDSSGKIIFPMYAVKIESPEGELLKNYHADSIYVEDCMIEENQLTLKRIKRSEETSNFVAMEDDQIMNNQVVTNGFNTIEIVAIDRYQKIVEIALKSQIKTKNLKIILPKEVLFEGDRNINVEIKSNEELFYVYGYDGVIASFSNPAKAVNLASSIAGIVTNNQGVYLYERSNRLVKNQIMAFVEEKVDEDRNSIAVCLDAMLRKEGVMRSTSVFLEQGQSVLEILNNNLEKAQILDLTGCNMDAVLYYPNIEIPVLALLEDGNAVLIVGYNDKNVVIFEPTSGKIYKKGMTDAREWFEKNGNKFITYIKNNE